MENNQKNCKYNQVWTEPLVKRTMPEGPALQGGPPGCQ